MVSITFSTKKLFEQDSSAYALFLQEDFSFEKECAYIASNYFPALAALFKERGFTGKASSMVVVPISSGKKMFHLIFVGLGDKKKIHLEKAHLEQYRRAVGAIIRAAESHKLSSVACSLPDPALFGVSAAYLSSQTTIIAQMANYHFDEFKRERISDKKITLVFCISALQKKEVEQGREQGEVIAQAVNDTRHWVDTPPSRLTPSVLANYAKKVAHDTGLAVTIFGEKEIIKKGMGGLAAVSVGSAQDCKFIILEYKTKKKKAPTIAFVGKGITFDSGGLSLKPAASMETMKEDMAGAAAVINAIGALARLNAEVNIVAVAPTSENLPSGTAVKPGDIIRFYNGKTAEVRNTDAEGRLILADALAYTVKHFKPDYLIDLATLTGACDYACGPFYSGLLSQHDEFTARVIAAAEHSGDRVWRLPMHDDYASAVTSSVADLSNTGKSKYRAGTITATFFLKEFVEDTPWVHLDIASNAFDVPGISYYESERPVLELGYCVAWFLSGTVKGREPDVQVLNLKFANTKKDPR